MDPEWLQIGKVQFHIPSFAKNAKVNRLSDVEFQGIFGISLRAQWGWVSISAFEAGGDILDSNRNPLHNSAHHYFSQPTEKKFYGLALGTALKHHDLYNDRGDHTVVSFWKGPSDGIVNFVVIRQMTTSIIFHIDRLYSLMRYKKEVKKQAFLLAEKMGVDIANNEKMDHELLQLLKQPGERLFKNAFEVFRSDERILKEINELEAMTTGAKII